MRPFTSKSTEMESNNANYYDHITEDSYDDDEYSEGDYGDDDDGDDENKNKNKIIWTMIIIIISLTKILK